MAGKTWRVLMACGTVLALTLLAGPAATTAAATTTAPGWHLVPGPALAGVANYEAVTATSRTDAWAVGYEGAQSGIPDGYPLVVHWNGRRWSHVTLPASTRELNLFTSVVAANARNVWTEGIDYATQTFGVFHFDGARWTEVPLPADVAEPGEMAMTRDGHLWLTGIAHLGSAIVVRWTGHGWAHIASPPLTSAPSGIVVLSDTDIWVTGPPTEFYHWNGRRWSRATTTVSTTGGGLPYLAALRPSDVWAAGSLGYNPNPHGGPAPAGLAHWDGHTWGEVQVPLAGYNPLVSITPDGAGGIWVVPTGSDERGALYLHWHAGTWTKVYAAAPPVPDVEDAIAVAWIPGTQRVWSVGTGSYGPVLRLYMPH